MKRVFLAAAMLALATGASKAADLPGRGGPAPFAAPPVFTWSGFYAGVNIGYAFGEFTGATGRNLGDADGFVGGGQIGYNYQFGSVVVGAEADLQYADISTSTAVGAFAGSRGSVDYFGTVRGRLGVAFDRLMPYLTAGYAYGGTELRIPALGKDDDVLGGYAIGAGAEYAFTQNVIGRIEGMYVDLGSSSFFNGAAQAGADFGLVRAGVNVKF